MDNIETIRAISPRYASLLEKEVELAAQLDEIGKRGRALTDEQNAKVLTWMVQQPRHKPTPKLRHQGAEALLEGLLPEQSSEEINPPPPSEVWHGAAELREVTAQVEALTEARRLLSIEIERARKEYSKQAAKQRAKEYNAIAAAIAKNAKALGDSILAQYDFIDRARRDGIEIKFIRPINVQRFGDLGGGTPLFDVIRHARELDYVSEGVPSWPRPHATTLHLLETI